MSRSNTPTDSKKQVIYTFVHFFLIIFQLIFLNLIKQKIIEHIVYIPLDGYLIGKL